MFRLLLYWRCRRPPTILLSRLIKVFLKNILMVDGTRKFVSCLALWEVFQTLIIWANKLFSAMACLRWVPELSVWTLLECIVVGFFYLTARICPNYSLLEVAIAPIALYCWKQLSTERKYWLQLILEPHTILLPFRGPRTGGEEI